MRKSGMTITYREARENKQLSVRQVSRVTGIPETTIRRNEKDSAKTKFSNAIKLCNLYGISLAHIWTGKEEDAFKCRQRAH